MRGILFCLAIGSTGLLSSGPCAAETVRDVVIYGETLSGIQRRQSVCHQFHPGVSAYVKKGDPSSGLLPGVEEDVPAPDGTGDGRVQAYCFRMCLTGVLS